MEFKKNVKLFKEAYFLQGSVIVREKTEGDPTKYVVITIVGEKTTEKDCHADNIKSFVESAEDSVLADLERIDLANHTNPPTVQDILIKMGYVRS